MDRMELLAPAGDMEKLKTAIRFGADAVYFGGDSFSLRQGADNFGDDDLKGAVDHCHINGVKAYITLNIFARNGDIEGLYDQIDSIKKAAPDAVIVSDPGILKMVREEMPEVDVHVSTQANTTNYVSAGFWYSQGAKRIIAARELSLQELTELVEKTPSDMEIEAFVHGAMCISYSGRCLLSGYMTGRDANQGLCAHPCRYKYALVEEKRPGEYYPVEEDDRGTYIMNSKDLCMIRHIPELANSGVRSLKIEGRMKSAYYVATVVRAYRHAIDRYYEDPKGYRFDEMWMDELCKASHREFTTGFYFGYPGGDAQNYETSAYIKDYSFTGVVKGYDASTGMATVEQRNKMCTGDEIEIFGKDISFVTQKIEVMKDAQTGEDLESAPHPKQMLIIKMDRAVQPGDLLRKNTGE